MSPLAFSIVPTSTLMRTKSAPPATATASAAARRSRRGSRRGRPGQTARAARTITAMAAIVVGAAGERVGPSHRFCTITLSMPAAASVSTSWVTASTAASIVAPSHAGEPGRAAGWATPTTSGPACFHVSIRRAPGCRRSGGTRRPPRPRAHRRCRGGRGRRRGDALRLSASSSSGTTDTRGDSSSGRSPTRGSRGRRRPPCLWSDESPTRSRCRRATGPPRTARGCGHGSRPAGATNTTGVPSTTMKYWRWAHSSSSWAPPRTAAARRAWRNRTARRRGWGRRPGRRRRARSPALRHLTAAASAASNVASMAAGTTPAGVDRLTASASRTPRRSPAAAPVGTDREGHKVIRQAEGTGARRAVRRLDALRKHQWRRRCQVGFGPTGDGHHLGAPPRRPVPPRSCATPGPSWTGTPRANVAHRQPAYRENSMLGTYLGRQPGPPFEGELGGHAA